MANLEIEEGEITEANDIEYLQNVSGRFFQEGQCIYGNTCQLHMPDKGLYNVFNLRKNLPFPDLVNNTLYGPEEPTEYDQELKEALERVKLSVTKESPTVKKQIKEMEWCSKLPPLDPLIDAKFPESSQHSIKKNELKIIDAVPKVEIVKNNDYRRSIYSSDPPRLSKRHRKRKRLLSSDTSSSISSSISQSHSKHLTKKGHRSRSSSVEYSRKCRRPRPSLIYYRKCRRSRSSSEEYLKRYRSRSSSVEYSRKYRPSRSSSVEYPRKYRRSRSSSLEYYRKRRYSRSFSKEHSRKCHTRSSTRLRGKKSSSTAKHFKKKKRSPSWDRHHPRKRSSLKSYNKSPSPLYVASNLSSTKRSPDKKTMSRNYRIKNRTPFELSMKKLLCPQQNNKLEEAKMSPSMKKLLCPQQNNKLEETKISPSMKKLLCLQQNNKLEETKMSPNIAPKKIANFPNSKKIKIKLSLPTRFSQPLPKANQKRNSSDMSISPLSNSPSKDELPQDQDDVATKTASSSLPIERQGKRNKDSSNTEKCFGSKKENIEYQRVVWSDEEEPNDHSEVFPKSKNAEVLEGKTSDQIEEELLEFRRNALLIFQTENITENSKEGATNSRRRIDSNEKDSIRKLTKQEKLEKSLAEIAAAIKRKRMSSDI